jgi:hypothetical protein
MAAAAAAAEGTPAYSTKKFHSPGCIFFARHQLGRLKRGELMWIK